MINTYEKCEVFDGGELLGSIIISPKLLADAKDILRRASNAQEAVLARADATEPPRAQGRRRESETTP